MAQPGQPGPSLPLFAQENRSHVNRAETGPDAGRDVNAKVQVIVDNFRPFVKDVQISSGEQPVYASTWEWNSASRKLEFQPDTVNKKADRSKPLHSAITTSEPMRLTTDAAGQPEGSMRIKLFARDPQDPDRLNVTLVLVSA